MQLPMMYHYNKEFYVPYGIIDTDIHHEINQQICITTDDEVLIKKGTPLCYLIPFKREKYKLSIEKYKKHYDRIMRSQYYVWTRFKQGYNKRRNS
jgi:hypothetical protein